MLEKSEMAEKLLFRVAKLRPKSRPFCRKERTSATEGEVGLNSCSEEYRVN